METPDDILYEVLLKLPTKMVFQATIISKKSSEIVNDEFFRHLHSKNIPFIPSPSTPLFITDHRDGNNNFIITLCLGQKYSRAKIYRIFISNNFIAQYWDKNPWYDNDYRIVNACNGLLCIVSNDDGRKQPIIICNLINREYAIVPPCCRSVGIGYCMKTEKYKLIAIADEKIMAYTLGADSSWREVDTIHDCQPFKGPVCIYGKLYWMLVDEFTIGRKRYLMSFDIEKEKTSMILEVTSDLNKWHCMGIRLTELGQEIAIVAHDESLVEIWTIDNFLWVKRCSIKLPRICSEAEDKYSSVMQIWERGDDVLVILMKDVMIFYVYKGEGKGRSAYYKYSFTSLNDSRNWELFSGYKPSFVALKEIVAEEKFCEF